MIEEIQKTQMSSVSVSKGMAGKYSWDVKIYFKEEMSNESVLQRLFELEESIKAKYGGLDESK